MSDERCWFAAVDERPDGAWAAAQAWEEDGEPAGWLAAWRRRSKPLRAAQLCDPRAFDPEGPEAWVSLALPPPQVRIVFDDHAVQHARRRVYAEGPFRAVTTLLRDPSTWGGALLAAGDRRTVLDDPFAAVWPARVLRVGPGLVAATPAVLPAPVLERYGQAWPIDRFPGARGPRSVGSR